MARTYACAVPSLVSAAVTSRGAASFHQVQGSPRPFIRLRRCGVGYV